MYSIRSGVACRTRRSPPHQQLYHPKACSSDRLKWRSSILSSAVGSIPSIGEKHVLAPVDGSGSNGNAAVGDRSNRTAFARIGAFLAGVNLFGFRRDGSSARGVAAAIRQDNQRSSESAGRIPNGLPDGIGRQPQGNWDQQAFQDGSTIARFLPAPHCGDDDDEVPHLGQGSRAPDRCVEPPYAEVVTVNNAESFPEADVPEADAVTDDRLTAANNNLPVAEEMTHSEDRT